MLPHMTQVLRVGEAGVSSVPRCLLILEFSLQVINKKQKLEYWQKFFLYREEPLEKQTIL